MEVCTILESYSKCERSLLYVLLTVYKVRTARRVPRTPGNLKLPFVARKTLKNCFLVFHELLKNWIFFDLLDCKKSGVQR